MSDQSTIQDRLAPLTASSPRGDTSITLILLHNDPRPSPQVLQEATTPEAQAAPHYYIDQLGQISRLVAEDRAAHHSGSAEWQGQTSNIDLLSIGITLEHASGSPYPVALLAALHELTQDLLTRYQLGEEQVFRWEPAIQGEEIGPGFLLPVVLPPVPPATPPDALLDLGGSGLDDGDTTCAPPPLPPDPDSSAVLGDEAPPPDPTALWALLHQESYRQRGEGFHPEWSLHQYAVSHKLGPPLGNSSGDATHVQHGGKSYLFQVFGRDTIFNEIPLWNQVQSLNTILGGSIPADGLARKLLEASFSQSGNPLHPDWAFHQFAAKQQLGIALSAAYRITVQGTEYSLQVFAGDLLYCVVGKWSTVLQLSSTPPGALREALWAEAYKPSGAPYQADTPFQQQAAAGTLGIPLTGVYQASLGSLSFSLQIFTRDTIYVLPGAAPALLSVLPIPANFGITTAQAQPQTQSQPNTAGDPSDALSDRRPTFNMLPIPGQPPISQFYGYTRFSASNQGRSLYKNTQGRHSGIDFSVPVGTELLAIAHGIVIHGGQDGPFGAKVPQSIVVRYGAIYALYGHASEVFVVKGQRVAPGDVLGKSGSYNGAHLHFELRIVPGQVIGSPDPQQKPVNPGKTFNPVDCFSSTLDDYFQRMLKRLGGGDGGFCCGGFRDQPEIIFGKPIDTRPCES